MSRRPFVLNLFLLLTFIYCNNNNINSNKVNKIQFIEIWYLPFEIDTRISVDEETIKSYSESKFLRINDSIKTKHIISAINNLKKSNVLDRNYQKNIRIVALLYHRDGPVDKLYIGLSRNTIVYKREQFVYDKKIMDLLTSYFKN